MINIPKCILKCKFAPYWGPPISNLKHLFGIAPFFGLTHVVSYKLGHKDVSFHGL